ncbi:MAG: hypothetical protein RI932_605 [Pseudomonadota bacterium]
MSQIGAHRAPTSHGNFRRSQFAIHIPKTKTPRTAQGFILNGGERGNSLAICYSLDMVKQFN